MAKKKKLASTFPNMVIVLALIAIASGLSLSSIFTITKGPIAKAKIEKKNKAIKAVLPEFASKEEMKFDPIVIHVAKDKDGNYVGAAVESEAMGFTQEVKLMVGFDKNNHIVRISVIEQKETPGLGTKMEGEWKDQFEKKDLTKFVLKVKKDKGDVDSITAATISARAFCKAVQIAYDNLKKNKANFLKAAPDSTSAGEVKEPMKKDTVDSGNTEAAKDPEKVEKSETSNGSEAETGGKK